MSEETIQETENDASQETTDDTIQVSVVDTVIQFDSGKEFNMILEVESAENLRKSFHAGDKNSITVINYSLLERKSIVQIDLSKVVLLISFPNEKVQNPEEGIFG